MIKSSIKIFEFVGDRLEVCVSVCKTNTLNKKVRARGQFY